MSDDDANADEVLDELREMIDADQELESIAPREAFDLWMQQQQDKSKSTLESYRYRIRPFLHFLADQEIQDLSEVTTRDIKEYEGQRYDANLEKQTINNQFGTLQLFLAYCQKLNAVSEDVVKAIEIPNLTKEDKVNTEKLITQRATEILDSLEKYRYASREHVIFLLLWRTTTRVGTVHSLDMEDVYLDEDDWNRLEEELRSEGFAPHVVEGILSRSHRQPRNPV
jgi:site-specific recombinase XerD